MTVAEEDLYPEPASWNQAAEWCISGIHERSMLGEDKSVDQMRTYLNDLITYNQEFPGRAEYWIRFWCDLGGIALKTARDLGIIDLTSAGSTEKDFVHVLVKKQKDYGTDNINRFGRLGLLVRIHDKIARLENLIVKGVGPENESLFDNYMDVVNYCAIGMMVEQEWFLIPLEEENV